MKGLLGEIFDFCGCQLSIQFSDEDGRRKQRICSQDKESQWQPIYDQDEAIEGLITLKIKPERTFEHQGIRAEVLGLAKYPESEDWKQFFLVSEDLSPPSVLDKPLTRVAFKFRKGVPSGDCLYASFESSELRIKYVLRVTVGRLLADARQERPIWISSLPLSESNHDFERSKNVEIGIENYIRVDFYLANLQSSLSGVLRGHIVFHALNLPIRTAQVCLVQKVLRLDTHAQVSQRILKAQQILDGPPVLNMRIPFRLGLLDCAVLGEFAGGGSIDEVGKLWAIKYFLQLVLIDTQERHYFKQHEVHLEYLATDVLPIQQNQAHYSLIECILTK